MSAPPGKEDLFDRILTQSRGRLLFVARQYALPGEAADLYQEIMYQLWKNLDQFKGRSVPTTWAYGVALNAAIMYRSSNFRRDRAWRAYGQNAQCEQRGRRGEDQILREFAQSLPDTERILFTLYLTNLSYGEIAEIAGISEAILRVKISRLRNQFERRYL